MNAVPKPYLMADTQMIREALEAKRDLDATRLHMTMQDFSVWIDALETNPEAQPEPCHL